MRKTVTHIDRYEWKLTVYSHFSCEYTNSILKHLADMGCDNDFLSRAEENMDSCHYNTGLAFSNPDIRESLVVVYRATSFGQFVNTLSHEIAHVCGHIAKVMDIYPFGEEFCVLVGNLMQNNSNLIKNYNHEN